MSASRTIATLLILALAGAAPAGPSPATTKPTTRPAAAPPAGWVRVDNPAGHFHYFVPGAWKAVQHTDAAAVYAAPRAKRQPPVLFAVTAGACHASTVEADAADFRAGLGQPAGTTAGAKLTRDAATTLGGRPAWAFEWHQPMMVAGRGPAGGPAAAKPVPSPKLTNNVLQVMRAEGSMHYILTYQGDPTGYAAGLASAKRVLDTFTWDAPPPPADAAPVK